MKNIYKTLEDIVVTGRDVIPAGTNFKVIRISDENVIIETVEEKSIGSMPVSVFNSFTKFVGTDQGLYPKKTTE